MPRLTSEGSPIRVDFLPGHLTGYPGRLGMTLAPGKHDARWQRTLDDDLGRLRDIYRTRTLVSLLEPKERELLGIEQLIPRARSLIGDVKEFPIRDYGVPESMSATLDLVSDVLELAAAGHNVIVHCRGGLGRAGLVAACVLVARGHSPARAMEAVRRARPDSVESDAQEQFVADFARACPEPLGPAAAAPSAPSFERIRGCLLAGALGDALGYPIEFEQHRAALARYGATAPDELAYAGAPPAEISDDTQMTLFTAEGLIRARQTQRDDAGGSVLTSVQGALLRWLATQEGRAALLGSDAGWLARDARLWHGRYPGNTCISALRAQHAGAAMPSVAAPSNDSKGCGAIMRVAPVGLVAASREQAFELGRDTSVITHGHVSGYLSAAYFAALVFDLGRDVPLQDAMRNADALLAKEPGREETQDHVERARDAARRGPPTPSGLARLGGGWTGESALAIALWVALSNPARGPASDALWAAVLHDGDSDSTGCLVGHLLGAAHGEAVLVPRWLRQLELADVIERTASDLYDATLLGSELDLESYPRS